eukprot:CAMPEP_0168396124 /NCGR_PEP_ID=MMETSP0228-20121227/20393_1 /TAXON_ID=133427 /ORGANISM="Protoceratium reticulatum, Strain CCCM 535 (=CCMP 1889)" /LENGTH=60 /DNA_ID=CAMNT_0008409569 /DNA_START=269 /DNA_END=448 /DNA_ORIENTATION=-
MDNLVHAGLGPHVAALLALRPLVQSPGPYTRAVAEYRTGVDLDALLPGPAAPAEDHLADQ